MSYITKLEGVNKCNMACKDIKSDVINGGSKDESKEAASARLEKLMGHGRFQLFQVWVFGALVSLGSSL